MTSLKKHFLEDSIIEIQEIKAAMINNRDKNMHIRYLVIYNYLNGYQNIQTAQMVGLCQHTVGTYIQRYKEKGLSGLIPIQESGAPRHLTKEQEQTLIEIVSTKTPDEVGFPNRKSWNALLIKDFVCSKFNVHYSHSGMLKVLHRLNMSFTRPTYTLAKADPIKQEGFKQKFELLKKLD